MLVTCGSTRGENDVIQTEDRRQPEVAARHRRCLDRSGPHHDGTIRHRLAAEPHASRRRRAGCFGIATRSGRGAPRRRRGATRRGQADHRCRAARRCEENHRRRCWWCRDPRRREARRGVGAPGTLLVATRRRNCGRRGDRIRWGGYSGCMGGPTASARLLLVLHRSKPHAGLLGCLPAVELERCLRKHVQAVTAMGVDAQRIDIGSMRAATNSHRMKFPTRGARHA
jgi:hypothetical protein